MATLTQGSQVFALVGSEQNAGKHEVLTVKCATQFSPGGNPADQIETTCLEASDRSYVPGLRTPEQASLTVNFDPAEESHVRLFDESQKNPSPTLQWALGWSDGAKDKDGENIDLPTVVEAGGIKAIEVVEAGENYDAPVVVTVSGDGSGATAEAEIDASGAIIGITIKDAGEGYTTATVSITGDSAGDGAVATAKVAEQAEMKLPTSRTWLTFDGYLADVPFDFETNSIVSSAVSIQRSGGAKLQRKAK